MWKSDGTGPGTKMAVDINPSGDSQPKLFTNVGGFLFFTADDGTLGEELWRSDGTSLGTGMADIYPG